MRHASLNGRLWRRHFLEWKAPAIILYTSLMLGITIWVADAGLDYFFYYEDGFFDLLLLDPPRHEIYIRFLILFCFVAFGGIVAEIVGILREREQNLRTTLHSIGDGVITTDTQGRIRRMNATGEQLTGWSLSEALNAPLDTVFRIVGAHTREEVANPVRKVLREGSVQGLANHTLLMAKNGREYQIADSAAPIRSDQGQIIGVVLVFRDVTEQYSQQEALRRSESYYRTLFETTGAATIVTDEDTLISQVNSNFEALSGCSREEIEGEKSWTEFVHPEDRERMEAYNSLRQQDPEAAPRHYEHRFIDCSGGEHHILLSVDMIPETGQRVASFADITERKQQEQKIHNLAYFDELTGLPNRISFYQRLKEVIARSDRNGGGSIFLVNISRLREVNDSLGQEAGNRLVREVAHRIRDTVREEDTVARVSGGEFSVLAEGVDSSEKARNLGMSILERASLGLELSGRSVYPGVSLGFTLFPHRGTDPDTLLKQADIAETEAKQSDHPIQEFAGQEDWISHQFHLKQDLKNALAQEEFFLCYQPQMDLKSGGVVGLEALLRWRHPDRGVVSPGEFIPLLEQAGMIVSVDEWVVNSVCEQLKSWREQNWQVKAAVNLSAQHFNNGNIVESFRSALKTNGLHARDMIVEITETSLMRNMDRALHILQTFSEWDMRVALDDFGKGYSCMSYLQKLGIHVIKIDKEFVFGLPDNQDSVILVQTIIAMAHNMGKLVLAEGVETEEQRRMLCDMGCDYGQGFLWGWPQPADAVFNAVYGR